MLALSAVSAVVLTTISIPSDDADAQRLSEEEMRAMRWWNSLGPDQKVAAVLGEVADPVDSDNPTTAEQQVSDTATALENTYGDLDATTDRMPIDNLTGRTATSAKGIVDELAGTLYPAGDHLPANDNNEMIGAIRGFQSVKLWWNYLDCQEMRIAVGAGNVAGTEGEGFCKMYEGITDSAAKARVDEVGIAILGRAEGDTGTYGEAHNARARAWWDTLDPRQRINALYGDRITNIVEDAQDDDTTPNVDERFDERVERDPIPYDACSSVPWGPTSRGLVNDRWLWIYNHRGGPNNNGLDEVVHWWNSLNCTQKRIATGVSNEHQQTDEGEGFCDNWDDLEDDDAQAISNGRQARVFAMGRAVLGLTPLPQVHDHAADVKGWWETLDGDQKEQVVYGNPPMRVQYDADGDTLNTPDDLTTDLTQADKDAVRKPYNMLGRIAVAANDTNLDTHLNAATVEILQRNGMNVDTPNSQSTNDTDPNNAVYYYDVKEIVAAIANAIFDPPSKTAAMTSPPDSGTYVDAHGQSTSISDDNDFNWPYNADNKPASVADWWESLDCRTMRMAVGEDNQYLNGAVVVEDDTNTEDVDESLQSKDVETSVNCRHFPGSADAVEDGPQTADVNESNIISEKGQRRVEEVGMALLTLSSPGRPSYNTAATGMPVTSGVAQVGSQVKAMKGTVDDVDDEGSITYKWFYGDAPDNSDSSSIGEGSTYDLKPGDAGNTIKVVAFFKDSHRYPEMRASGVTTEIAGSPGEISRIEPAIPILTVGAGTGDKVRLSVDIYGLQNAKDNSIGAAFRWTQDKDTSREEAPEGTGREIVYTAPSSPGTYTVTATLGGGECQPDVEDNRDTACSADFTVQARRIHRFVRAEVPPVNPPGDIPTILTDSDGNQYEVFTPVEGGTFDGGEGYSVHAPPGAIPDGEFIGVRMSDEGGAFNVGMSHQRYTLCGNMYGVHAVDASGDAISGYALDDPASVCVPLPVAFRTNISDLALVGVNSDGLLTIHTADVRIKPTGVVEVCGNVSNLPTKVAVGSQGAPAPISTATPEPVPELPPTGATAPTSNGVLWLLSLGIAILLTMLTALYRRRTTTKQT